MLLETLFLFVNVSFVEVLWWLCEPRVFTWRDPFGWPFLGISFSNQV